ncbi:hypothetical protein LRK53_11615 [Rhodanobacter thiooxydans]|nr:hypothetical protein [Rhodanobacter thiooxydans]UJJ53629.1 hypothetical protein LRK53_11615 [Rhodanobacter thiooxydans]
MSRVSFSCCWGQVVHPLVDPGLLPFQLADLLDQRLVGRVFGSDLALHVRLLQAQLLDVGLDRHFLVQQTLGLHADVDRMRPDLAGVERRCGPLQVAAHVGQLIANELRAVRRFRRIAAHVLAHVVFAHLPEHIGCKICSHGT